MTRKIFDLGKLELSSSGAIVLDEGSVRAIEERLHCVSGGGSEDPPGDTNYVPEYCTRTNDWCDFGLNPVGCVNEAGCEGGQNGMCVNRVGCSSGQNNECQNQANCNSSSNGGCSNTYQSGCTPP